MLQMQTGHSLKKASGSSLSNTRRPDSFDPLPFSSSLRAHCSVYPSIKHSPSSPFPAISHSAPSVAAPPSPLPAAASSAHSSLSSSATAISSFVPPAAAAESTAFIGIDRLRSIIDYFQSGMLCFSSNTSLPLTAPSASAGQPCSGASRSSSASSCSSSSHAPLQAISTISEVSPDVLADSSHSLFNSPSSQVLDDSASAEADAAVSSATSSDTRQPITRSPIADMSSRLHRVRDTSEETAHELSSDSARTISPVDTLLPDEEEEEEERGNRGRSVLEDSGSTAHGNTAGTSANRPSTTSPSSSATQASPALRRSASIHTRIPASTGLKDLLRSGGRKMKEGAKEARDSGLSACRTVARTERIEFVWEVAGWAALRKLAKLKSLPYKDRLLSPDFGKKDCGTWHLALFPYGDRTIFKNVSLYLFGDKQAERIAEFSFCVLDGDLNEVPNTRVSEEVTSFTSTDCSWGWHEFLTENDLAMAKYVFDDVLRVKVEIDVICDVTHGETEQLDRLLVSLMRERRQSISSVYGGTPASSTSKNAKTSAATKGLYGSATEFVGAEESGNLELTMGRDAALFAVDNASHDITLKCGQKTMTANRFICAARSSVLRAMLYGDFLEGRTQVINIMDVAQDVMENFVDFISTDSCALLEQESPDAEKVLSLYEAADKYQIMGLRYRCECLLAQSLNNNNFFDILQVAEERGCSYLVNAAYYYVQHKGSICEVLNGLRSQMRSSGVGGSNSVKQNHA